MFRTKDSSWSPSNERPYLTFVGPCGAGKSTLTKHFRALGMTVRMPAQEHSSIPDLWRRRKQPDYLIALDAPNEILRSRRPGALLRNDAFFAKERRRLAHAFAHADLKLDTSTMSINETIEVILAWLKEQNRLKERQ